MDNRVGDNAPNDKKFEDLLAQLQSVLAEMKKFGVVHSKDERKELVHPRNGADEHVARVHTLANKYGVTVPSIPLTGMLADMRLAKAMTPYESVTDSLKLFAADTKAQAEHEYWQAFLAYYGVLGNMSARIPELAAELEPVVKFMATGRRPKTDEPK